MTDSPEPTQGPAPDENRFLLVITAEAEVVKAAEAEPVDAPDEDE